jgi:hypothetical protein
MTTLLIDTMPLVFSLEESKDDGKLGKVVARGPYARSDKATENKRLYKKHLWEREISRLNENMVARRTFGELDHPADGRTKLQRVSHLLTGLKVDGHNVVGESEILDTPMGRILKAIMAAGAQVGVSSRGFGSTKTLPDGTEEVQEDFRLDTFDFVADPATRTAYPQVFHEELQRIPEDDMGLTVEELKTNYPGLVEEITASVLSESERRTEERLKERFSGELRRKMEQIDEAAEERVRSEFLSDPEVAGAKQIVERIASMVASFANPVVHQQELSTRDDRISKLEGDVAERELEVQESQKKHDEMAVIAKEAAYRLHMERKVAAHPARDAIVKLIGNMAQYESTDALDERIEVLQKELAAARDEHVGEEDSAKGELVDKIDALTKRVEKAEERAGKAEGKLKEANDRTRQAIDIAESVQVESYLKGIVEAHDEGDEIAELCEGARSIEEVDRIMESFGRRTIDRGGRSRDEDEAERIRARVGRGQQRSLEEDTFGAPQNKPGNGQHGATLDDFGLTEGEFDELAGTGNLTS